MHVVAARRPRRAAEPTVRRDWEAEVEAEAGMFGRALLDGGAVLGWMQAAPAALVRRDLPTGPPSADSYLLACAFFYDEQFLPGFQMLLQDVVAALKLRRIVALEAYALRDPSPDDRFTGYLRELNLFNAPVLEGCGFSRLRTAGHVGRYRLELETLIAAPRRSRAPGRGDPGRAGDHPRLAAARAGRNAPPGGRRPRAVTPRPSGRAAAGASSSRRARWRRGRRRG